MYIDLAKQYLLASNIKKAAEDTQAGPSKRSAPKTTPFDFGNLCFICDEDASDNFIKKELKNKISNRVKVRSVLDNKVRNKIVEFCTNTPTDIAEKVLSRILDIPDLVEVGARYRVKCYKKFYNYKSTNTVGRPLHPAYSAAENYVINYNLDNTDERQFSLKSILESYTESSEFIECPSMKYMKKLLKMRFANEILFYSVKKDLYMCYRGV